MKFRDFLNELNEGFSSDMLKNDIVKNHSKEIAEKFAYNNIPFQDLKFTQVATNSAIPIYNDNRFYSIKFRNLVKKYSDTDTDVAVVALTEGGSLVVAKFGYYSPKEFKDKFSYELGSQGDAKSNNLDKLWVATTPIEDRIKFMSVRDDRRAHKKFVDPLVKNSEKFKEKLDASNSLSPFVKELKQMCSRAGADMSKFKCSLKPGSGNYMDFNLYAVFKPVPGSKGLDIVIRNYDITEDEINQNIKNIIYSFGDGAYTIRLEELIQYGDKIVKMAKDVGEIKKFIESHKYSDLLS